LETSDLLSSAFLDRLNRPIFEFANSIRTLITPLIATDGIVGQNTLGAIADFQTNITGVVDRLIGIDGVAIRQLESIHLSTVTAQPGIDWIAVLPELAEIAAIFNQDAELVAASRTEFESSALDYLTALSGRDIGEVGVA
jgi:lysozyme family protein